MAGPGKGLSYDGGDAFGIKIANQLQTHYTFTANDSNLGPVFGTDTSSFNVRRARTSLSGHVHKKSIMFKLMLDGVDAGAGGDGNVKDGHVTWNFVEGDSGEIGLRMGQAKTQFGLEGTGTSKGLFFVERSTSARDFSDTRSTGAWLLGTHLDNKLRWSAGAMNGATAAGLGAGYIDVGEEAGNSDNELSYVFTGQFDPLGDAHGGKERESWRQGDFRTEDRGLKGTVGVGIGLENGRSTATGTDVEGFALNLNTAWSIEGWQFMGEYFMRTDDQQGVADEEEPKGWAVSGTWVMPKSGDSAIQWGFGARVNMAENDNGSNATVNFLTGIGPAGLGAAPGGELTEVSLVANAFYHGHACKTQIEYTLQQLEATGAPDSDNHIVRIAFQLLF